MSDRGQSGVRHRMRLVLRGFRAESEWGQTGVRHLSDQSRSRVGVVRRRTTATAASGFRARLLARATRVGLTIPDDAIRCLDVYYHLFAKWNARTNLTAFQLSPPSDAALDRLFIEPLIAAAHLPPSGDWFDLGSGGGSPALPLKLFRPGLSLTMVEAKSRKAAFLREVLRTLELDAATVQEGRFETIAAEFRGRASIVTVRAVNVVESARAAAVLLGEGGLLLLFQADAAMPEHEGFRRQAAAELVPGGLSYLAKYTRSFHVEQRR